MQTLETVKSRSQASFNQLVEKAKEQPDEVKTWGVTAGGAVVGALALTAVAGGILAVVAALAATPVALTVGAVGGGVLGWNYMRNRQVEPSAAPIAEAAPSVPAESTLVAERSPVPAAIVVDDSMGDAVLSAVVVDQVAPVMATADTLLAPVIDESFTVEPVIDESLIVPPVAEDQPADRDPSLPTVSAAVDEPRDA